MVDSLKKTLVYLALFLCIIITAFKKDLKGGCNTFLSLNFKDKISVYSNSSKQKILKKMGHNFEDEDYLLFKILNSTNTMYYIEVSYAIAGETTKGWISKDTKLSVFVRPLNNKVKIYSSYSKKSTVTLINYFLEEVEVSDCHNGWLKIKMRINNKVISGWLPAEEQCSNPYTTCN